MIQSESGRVDIVFHTDLIKLGNNVKIHNTAVINSEGFGFEKDDKGAFTYPLKRNEHNYKVIINDNVEIGPFVVVDRGSWRDTIIGESCKLDSNVKIAHNVQMNKNNLLVHGVVLGGSVTIGDNCFFGMNVCVKQHTKIGSYVIIDAGIYIKEDIDDYTIVTKDGGTLKFMDVRLKDKWRGMVGLLK